MMHSLLRKMQNTPQNVAFDFLTLKLIPLTVVDTRNHVSSICILEAKAVLHKMRHNFLFWKLCNHILSHAALSWHQEYTSHMISCSFVIEVKSHRMVTGHDHFWKSVYWQLGQNKIPR